MFNAGGQVASPLRFDPACRYRSRASSRSHRCFPGLSMSIDCPFQISLMYQASPAAQPHLNSLRFYPPDSVHRSVWPMHIGTRIGRTCFLIQSPPRPCFDPCTGLSPEPTLSVPRPKVLICMPLDNLVLVSCPVASFITHITAFRSPCYSSL